MKLVRLLLVLPLTLLATGVSSDAAAQTAGPGGPGPGTGPVVCQTGHAKGTIELPKVTPMGIKDGEVDGKLLYHKKAKFELSGKLTLIPTPGVPGKKGEVHGVLKKLHGPGQKPTFFAKVEGKWTADKDGVGEYKLAVIKPGPTPLAPDKLIGHIKAKFQDKDLVGPGGNPLPGHFHGSWKICK